MILHRIAAALALGAVAAAATPARAADVDYVALFRSKVIKCIHPTVNVDKSSTEITKPAETKGDVTTVRLKTYYDGMVKKNVMESDLMVRQAGSIRQMKVNTLADSGSGGGRCAIEKNWTDF